MKLPQLPKAVDPASAGSTGKNLTKEPKGFSQTGSTGDQVIHFISQRFFDLLVREDAGVRRGNRCDRISGRRGGNDCGWCNRAMSLTVKGIVNQRVVGAIDDTVVVEVAVEPTAVSSTTAVSEGVVDTRVVGGVHGQAEISITEVGGPYQGVTYGVGPTIECSSGGDRSNTRRSEMRCIATSQVVVDSACTIEQALVKAEPNVGIGKCVCPTDQIEITAGQLQATRRSNGPVPTRW